MPPEPLPWDRKDFFKERKHNNNNSHHDRTASDSLLGGGGGPLTRWRDYSSSSSHCRELPRWGSVDCHRTPGHGKQGGWYSFAEESCHGDVPSRTGDKMLEDESTHMSVLRGDGKYGRNVRENKGSLNHKDWKGHSWETSNGSSNIPGRLQDLSNDQRSVDDMLTCPSHPQSDFVNTWDHLQLKDQHDNKMGGVNGFHTGQRCDRENSLDWRPLKWTRSGSLSSRGSGFSHSSSSKSLGGIDSNEGKAELQPKNANPVQSPSGDAATYVMSATQSEETTSRKKPRLGWGEGLAKYEKKKVEGPDARMNKDGVVVLTSHIEPAHSLSSNLAEKSPRVVGLPDCASPTTPSSVACSSSSGVEENTFSKAASVDNDNSNLCGSPSIGSQNHLEGFLFNLEKLDSSSITNLGCSLVELLHPDDSTSSDSSFVRNTGMNKLLILKGDILKTLEVTESEIDSLENELKSLRSELGSNCPCPATFSSLPVEGNLDNLREQGAACNLITQPASLQTDSCGEGLLDVPDCSQGAHANVKDEDVDSPGTATSKFDEPLTEVKREFLSYMVKKGESGDLDGIQSENVELKCTPPGSGKEEVTGSIAGRNGNTLSEIEGGALVSDYLNLYADGEKLCDIILGCNKELSRGASEVFNKLLPKDHCNVDFWGVTNVLQCQDNSSVKEKFVKRKQFLRFKERVLTLKFKAFQHLWKEDMRLLSIRKYRVTSQKKCQLISRITHSGYQKHRSSIRSRFSSPGNLSLVPTTEIINFTSKLLSDSQIKVYRDFLKMPALISDKKEKMVSRFISSNGLVEDPCAVEKERAMINPWTVEEREIFMDKLATFGKDFRKIASFLDYKTTADCVEFYYKNRKSDCFEKIKKRPVPVKPCSNTYFMRPGKKWDRQMNAASLDILGEATEMAAAFQADNVRQISGRISLGGCSDSKLSFGDDGMTERSSSFDVHGNERETAAADVLAGICGSLSSEAMSSCITSSVDPGEGQQEWKHQKMDSFRRHSTSDVTQNVDDDTCSDESCGEMDPADWTDEEKSIFIQAVSSYGKDFIMISRCVRTRSSDQCKVFFSKARKCLGLDLIHTGRGTAGTCVSDEANGGGSDTEDACVLETSSVISNDKMDSKVDDLPSSGVNKTRDKSDLGTMNLPTDLNKSGDENGERLLDDQDSKDVSPLVSDDCKRLHNPEVYSEFERMRMDNVDCQSESLQAHKIPVEFVEKEGGKDKLAEQAVGLPVPLTSREAMKLCSSGLNVVVETTEAPVKGYENGLEDRIEPNKTCKADEHGGRGMVQGSNVFGNIVDLTVDTNSCSVPPKSDSGDKLPVMSLPLENSLASVSSVPQVSAASQCEKSVEQNRLSSTLDFQGNKDKSACMSVGNEDYHRNLLGHSLLNHVEHSQILKGYPLQISSKKEMNGDISCRQLSEVQGISKSDRSDGVHYMAQDCYIQKCSSSMSHASVPELPFLASNLDQKNDPPRSHSRSLSDTDRPRKNGDVKLFGKILSRPSSSQKPNSSSRENEEKGAHHHKQSCKVSNLKFTASHPAEMLKFDRNNYLGLENVPMRSYGFWDGNRIQTGYSSLPDSAILLAKYPTAFGNYPGSSSKMEHQALQVKSSECNLKGVAVLPQREISSSNGVVDYQVYRSSDVTKVQPFAIDVKQRQDLLFSEMQRRNAFEALSTLPQPGRGMVGVNVVGRGGILVGGPCTGISDPVAAIKRHYAKADQYGGQSGSIIREEESWRSNGDIGR
ncbi:uncharacterized protein LOC123193044 isoform X2 [Mangifera indica]|uniref:uncharacterized protein LOC123193044 isoform X2 n=1 Tax=Mangifera indica TaxID=29780 RepID=UPI001CFA59FB|nr:uncharacterized protein LOC123193044 isoform X2 [Mangifera indica]